MAARNPNPEPGNHSYRARCRVVIRRDIGRAVRPEAEELDGHVFTFGYGWTMDTRDPYPGESAMLPLDFAYAHRAPTWIASGDLEVVDDV
jgi:hypothetical protein